MKKYIKILIVLASAALLASCSMFKLDNYDGPNAQIYGQILDVKTNEPVGIEATYSSELDWATVLSSGWTIWQYITVSKGALVVNELGWKDKDGKEVYDDQRWAVRFDGSYRNNLIFAADYNALFQELPCYELDNPKFTAKQGENKVDFTVTPFCRIYDESFSYDETNKQMVAKFKVELGDATKANSILNLKFCANTQVFVGANYFNLVQDGDAGAVKQGADLSAYGMGIWPAAQPGEEVTLTINCDPAGPNTELFKYTQERYVRIGAQAGGNGFNGNSFYNFSKTYKVSTDLKTFSVVEWPAL